MVECTYDTVQMKNRLLKTMTCSGIMYPGPNGATAEQIAASLSSPARQALREWAENPSGPNSSQTVEKPWLVRTYRRQIKYCPFAESHYVFVSYAAEGYPLKASLPVLIPVWAFSLALALFCAAILSYALLRVWRRQERVEQVRRETTAALAHELKTPLSVLSAAAELLEDNLAPEKQAHYLDVIQTQAQRMDGSVRKMLELSRLGDRRAGAASRGIPACRPRTRKACRRAPGRRQPAHGIGIRQRIHGQRRPRTACTGTGRAPRKRRAAHT